MASYIIGDIQGCYNSLTKLLQKIAFNPARDVLWIAGDLINRGENSLATLRLIYQYRSSMFAILGNHDLHLLSTYYQKIAARSSDTFTDILLAADAPLLLQWLLERPLCHYFENFHLFLSHAGLYPGWSVQQALTLGETIQQELACQTTVAHFFSQLYGNQPSKWHHALTGADRARFIINALTRMRFLTADLHLDMQHKGPLASAPAGLLPWFNHPTALAGTDHIAFGHWAALQGQIATHTNGEKNVYALDTGCVWQGTLTALHLEKNLLISI